MLLDTRTQMMKIPTYVLASALPALEGVDNFTY